MCWEVGGDVEKSERTAKKKGDLRPPFFFFQSLAPGTAAHAPGQRQHAQPNQGCGVGFRHG
jgi:hypothetical protein